jgi:hypothetical protein
MTCECAFVSDGDRSPSGICELSSTQRRLDTSEIRGPGTW